ncbi:MAG: hypothetical protein AVDCRST_MAG26-3479 [uncultured Chloroflexia bacterium]|uniref:Response regulatory domain-containing protein n=1 Tax=uncultured Chloroflexia bacterium TaxID=1672391 RepID=A0A6J4JMM4_9CHLR|nr:MAG: hypothetical protein AVDCRST_MAG26-3479 [uncultured Chloroflexia bacterium]
MTQRILVIEDHEGTREMVETVLEGAGYETVGHADHTTAHEQIREVHPDLIIADLMQGSLMRGWNTLLAATLDPDTREIPVLLMSVNQDYLRDNRQYLREHGCDTLEKPFHPAQLVTKVRAALGDAPQPVR